MSEQSGIILLVDDDLAFRKPAAEYLASKGNQVYEATNVEEAKQVMAGAVGPTLTGVVCAWRLVGEDGLAFLQWIRSGDHKALPFLMLTGSITRDDLQPLLTPMLDAIVLKPVAPDVLLRRIAQAKKTREEKEMADLLKAL